MVWCIACVTTALLLLVSANGAPLLIGKLLGQRFQWPVDNNFRFSDGRPLFGQTKTWRGVIAAVFMTIGTGLVLGISPLHSALFAVLAMLGDILASFCKRRFSKAESSRARGFDTVPESVIPLLVFKAQLDLSGLDIVLTVGLFFLIEEFVSPLLYKWHIRQRPY